MPRRVSSMQYRALIVLFCVVIFGCANDTRRAMPPGEGEAVAESDKFHRLLEDYFDEFLALSPLFATSIGDHRFDDRLAIAIDEEQRERRHTLYLRYREQMRSIRVQLLDQEARLSMTVFERMLARNLDAFAFSSHLQPVRQLNSLPVNFPRLGAGNGSHPFKSVADYDNFLKRIDRFRTWVDTAIANMRKGIARGIVQPRVVMEKTLPQLDAMIVTDPTQSAFYQPILRLPQQFSAADRTRLTQSYKQAIEQKIVPAYVKLRNFIVDEYLPHTRSTYGFSSLPDGDRWYDYLVRSQTTTSLTPEEIFQLGVNEMQRIKNEMARVRVQNGFYGSAAEFGQFLANRTAAGYTSRDDLVRGYETIRQRVTPGLRTLFGHLPRSDFEIRTVEEFREQSAPSGYQAAVPDGTRPGVFYANAARIVRRPIRPSEALFLHEAVPGHHLQISIQREQQGLPRFRRFIGYNAFVEGWALYAESLGRELGLYTDPYQYMNRLNSELFRAVRLVVDVGLHRKNWTRDHALKFMMENADMGESRASLEVDRYIARPAQALSYKIGQLKISAIRAKAEKLLGAKFDIRDFHDELLKDGAMPLDLLEAKMDVWIKTRFQQRVVSQP